MKRGDTLSQIALRYGSAAEAILQMNRLKSVETLKLNSELVIPVAAGHRGARTRVTTRWRARWPRRGATA